MWKFAMLETAWSTSGMLSELIDDAASHGAISWTTAGDQLVVWDNHKASVVDIQGQVQTSIEFEPAAGPEQDPSNPRMPVQRAVACNPDSQLIAFGCVDGSVRIWDTNDQYIASARIGTSRRSDPCRALVARRSVFGGITSPPVGLRCGTRDLES